VLTLAQPPFGFTVREFGLLCLGFFAIFMGSMTLIIWVIFSAWRDRGIAKYNALSAEKRSRKPQESLPRASSGPGQGARHPLGQPAPWARQMFPNAGGMLIPEIPRLSVSTPTPKGDEPEPRVDRITATAGQNPGATKLDITPTEESV
jgi:hypothetical protein